MENEKKDIRLSWVSKQAKGDGKMPKNPDVPRDGYDPKSQQDSLPQKSKK